MCSFYCTDVRTLFSHQYLIERLPKVLLLHLDRVDDRHISFPLLLDIAPYCCNTDVSYILLISYTFTLLNCIKAAYQLFSCLFTDKMLIYLVAYENIANYFVKRDVKGLCVNE